MDILFSIFATVVYLVFRSLWDERQRIGIADSRDELQQLHLHPPAGLPKVRRDLSDLDPGACRNPDLHDLCGGIVRWERQLLSGRRCRGWPI
jgi:hypothetical protein